MSHDHDHDPQPTSPSASTPTTDAGALALSEALRSSFNVVKFLMLVLVVAFVASGVFTVKPNQVAVLLRFGRPLGVGAERILQPGLHWKLPAPIDEFVPVSVGETHTLVSKAGWYFITPEEEATDTRPQENSFLRPGVDGYTLTGDGNIIHVKATLSYRVSDPIAYTFDFARTTNLLQAVLDNAIAYASARFVADEALYRNKVAFQETVLARVNEAVDRLKLGVTIDPREVLTKPPLYVESAFNDVVRAQQRGDTRIREAEADARSVTNKAVGEASAVVRDGVTRSNIFVTTLQADATNFLGLLPSYERDPLLFVRRLQAENVERVLTNATFKTYLPARADGRPREVRLMLNKELAVPTKGEATPAR